MPVSIEKIHPALGVEVKGVDLSQPIDPQTSAMMRKAFDDNVVLVVRNQNLNEEQQLRAAEIFGKVAYRRRPVAGDGPGGDYDTPFMLVTNIVENGKPIGAFGDGEMWFHHDTSYYPEPHRATLLYAHEADDVGRRDLFLQHVHGIRQDSARAARQARRPQGPADARLQAPRAPQPRHRRPRRRSATTGSRSLSRTRRRAGNRSMSRA